MKPESFFGWTNPDGTKLHNAPANWPFGTIGPITEYGFRYAPDAAVYEKQPKSPKSKLVAVAEEPVELGSSFDYMATILSTIPFKIKS